MPVVQVVAAGELFRKGIMVKDGSALERLAEIDTVAFDKTGTLTIGRPRLVEATQEGNAVAIAAGMAAHSRHPLSVALVRGAAVAPRRFDAVTEVPGGGLEVSAEEGLYRLGSAAFACGGDLSADTRDAAYSEAILSRNGQQLARFRFEDMLRPGAADAVAQLAASGVESVMLSGDRKAVVDRTAAGLGIRHAFAALTPKGKVEACANLGAGGHRVLMVGDGINDAPALAAAHVSMAPASASDIGRQAADLVFFHDRLDAVPQALRVARRAGRLIRQNFVLAIGYNILAVPVAIAGYATPLIAAVAMSTSSIIVVLNALRLNTPGKAPGRPAVPMAMEARPS